MPASLYDKRKLTDWERRKADLWLSKESHKIRTWRNEAEEPNTTGERLTWINNALNDYTEEVYRRGERFFGYEFQYYARSIGRGVRDAIVSHPNTPPNILTDLVGSYTKAFCRNPVAPFVLLETPDFIAHLGTDERIRLLSEESIPLSLLKQMMIVANEQVAAKWTAHEAGYHIAVAGEISSRAEWESQVEIFWRKCYALGYDLLNRERVSRPDLYIHHVLCFYHDLAELGFAPNWVRQSAFNVDYYEREPFSEVNQWLQFDCPSGSPEERELWERIAPRFKRRIEIAAWVGRDATEDTLARLASLPDEVGCLREVIAAHPNTTARVMRRFRLPRIRDNQQYRVMVFDLDAQYCLVTRPDTPSDVLARLTQSRIAQIRLLARRHKNAPLNSSSLSRWTIRHELKNKYGYWEWPERYFAHFNAALHGLVSNEELAENCIWVRAACLRLAAAVALSNEPVPVANPYLEVRTTTRDLLEHLARDGNRLVRWAAQTRLQNPDYVFRWAEPE